MAKKNPAKKFQHRDSGEDFGFDSSEFVGSHSEDELVTTMMEGLIQASSQQTLAAIELTKIAIAKILHKHLRKQTFLLLLKTHHRWCRVFFL